MQTTAAKELYLTDFRQAEAALPGASVPWVRELRQRAAGRFAELDFPNTKLEDWRYTSVEPLLGVPFARAVRGAQPARELLAALPFAALELDRLVFVDGHFAPELSSVKALPAGVIVDSFAAALERHAAALQPHLAQVAGFERHGFLALNTALASDGAVVLVPRGVRLARPIELAFLSTRRVEPAAAHLRNLVVAEEGSELTLVETYVGAANATYFNDVVTEVVVAENAGVRHVKLQRENDSAFHISTIEARQARDSRFSSHSVALGGALARTEVHTQLGGAGADARLFGLYVPRGRQLLDHHTFIDHAVARCTSNELYKGVLDGMSRGVFNGKILVRRDAQKTAAFQSNRNLLLSDDAVADTRPQLEIYADDVKCSHGATIGRLDEDALFYLRSRGIGEAEARHLLTYAFAGEVLGSVAEPALRAALQTALEAALPGFGGAVPEVLS